MAQSDINVANQTAPLFRTDLNNALEALATNSSGTSAPTTLFGYMFWYDSTNDILKLNLSGNWVSIAKFDTGTNTFLPYIGSTQVTALLDEDTMSSNSATAVATQQSIKAYVDNNGLGVGQTWQNVLGSRSLGTSYQNTTGKPIMVNVMTSVGGSVDDGVRLELSTNNSTWVTVGMRGDDNSRDTFSAIVPKQHYYRARQVSGSVTIHGWAELR